MKNPYEEIGGHALRAIMSDFYNRLFSDPMLCFLFCGKDKQRLIEKDLELTAHMLGGRVKYTGRSLRESHAHSLILEGHFYRRLHILEKTLIDHKAPESVRTTWIEHTIKLKPTIKRAVVRRLLPSRFELFVGSPEQRQAWKDQGTTELLEKLGYWILWKIPRAVDHTSPELEQRFQVMLRQVTKGVLTSKFDNAVSAAVNFATFILRSDLNELSISRELLKHLVISLAALAPRLAEALWESFAESGSVFDQPYPQCIQAQATPSGHTGYAPRSMHSVSES